MIFIIIGLMCNPQECYWVKAHSFTEFTTLESCKQQALNLKKVSIMYFDTSCMVKE
jgi:hypothetical protein